MRSLAWCYGTDPSKINHMLSGIDFSGEEFRSPTDISETRKFLNLAANHRNGNQTILQHHNQIATHHHLLCFSHCYNVCLSGMGTVNSTCTYYRQWPSEKLTILKDAFEEYAPKWLKKIIILTLMKVLDIRLMHTCVMHGPRHPWPWGQAGRPA